MATFPILRLYLLLPLLLAGLAACGDDPATPETEREPAPEPEPAAPASIEVTPEDPNIQVDDSVRFEATVLDEEGNEMSDVSVAWVSSDSMVLTIADDGLATGVGPGFADVTAFADSAVGAASARVMLPLGGRSGIEGNIFYGYQGWFGCPGDGTDEGWLHWFFGQTPIAENVTVDMWPDVSELDDDERCRTGMTLPDGSPAYAFSSHNRKTVMRHFRWMQEYGLDGAVLQRYADDPGSSGLRRERNVVSYARDAAEIYGRRFFMMYGNVEEGRTLDFVARDWAAMVDDLGLTDSPSYVKVDGAPVVGIWGFGFRAPDVASSGATPEEALEVIRWLQEEAPPRMRAVVLGGVPAYWRTLTRDSRTDPAWAEVYRSYDVISPWSVGRFDTEIFAEEFVRDVVGPDLEETRRLGIGYMPVAWPGFSIHNLLRRDPHQRPDEIPPLNEIPRDGGRFFWRQIHDLVAADVSTVYVAMFDEIDEGTAMFKLAPTEEQAPLEPAVVTLDIDGYDLPSDWYLQLGREAGRMLRGEIPLSPEMPITPP